MTEVKKSRKPWLKWTLGILIAFIVLAVVAGDDNGKTVTDTSSQTPQPEQKKTIEEEKAISVSAIQFYKAYEENEVAADNKYKGKKIEITGKVESINKDIADDVYVVLSGGEFMGVSCHLQEAGKAAELKKGQKITLVGVGGTMIMGVPNIEGCEIK